MLSTNHIEQDEAEQKEGSVLPEDEEQPVDQEEPTQGESGETSVPVPDPLKCTLHFTITMLATSGKESGRQVLLGARTDDDDPLVELTHANTIDDLLPTLQNLYERLVTGLPERKASTQKRLAAQPRRQEKTTKEPAQTKISTPVEGSATSDELTKASTQVETSPIPTSKSADPGRKPASKRGSTADMKKQTEQMTLF